VTSVASVIDSGSTGTLTSIFMYVSSLQCAPSAL
jgi:hypothetical protein